MTYPPQEPPPPYDPAGQQPPPYYPGYPPPPYYGANPYYPYGYPRRETDGLAIASLVVSCAAVLGLCSYGVGGVLGIVGAILGHVARGRIRRTGQGGDGMALAGIIVGWALTVVCIVLALGLIYLFTHAQQFDRTDG
jgi:hypothetical protein